MGDMGEAFKDFKEVKQKIRNNKEPQRFEYAMKSLSDYNYKKEYDKIIVFLNKGTVTFYPFTGWFQGQKPYGNIKGRGIDKLIKQLKNPQCKNRRVG